MQGLEIGLLSWLACQGVCVCGYSQNKYTTPRHALAAAHSDLLLPDEMELSDGARTAAKPDLGNQPLLKTHLHFHAFNLYFFAAVQLSSLPNNLSYPILRPRARWKEERGNFSYAVALEQQRKQQSCTYEGLSCQDTKAPASALPLF